MELTLNLTEEDSIQCLKMLSQYSVKVSATLKIAIFPYLRFLRFQIDMLESFLLKKKIRRKYYFCRKISGVKIFSR